MTYINSLCPGCNTDADCTKEGTNKKCDPDDNQCKTICLRSNDCPRTEDCDYDHYICRPRCIENEDCKVGICDKTKQQCVPGNTNINTYIYGLFNYYL